MRYILHSDPFPIITVLGKSVKLTLRSVGFLTNKT